jgi:tetratricopeptide (TPR) repeat protein
VTISLCLIAKDEEKLLPGCLASVEGAVDEIVLVDTGSTDRTREIARAAGARVFEQPWCGDFSAPRNEALRHAKGDWILQLDADERLAPGAGRVLRRAVRRARFDCGMLPLHNAATLDADPRQVVAGRARTGPPVHLPRLLRNVDGLEYRGIIHEGVEAWLTRRGRKVALVDAHLVHLGSVPELRAALGKRERNLALLRRRCELEPSDVAAFGFLAHELLEIGDDEESRRVVDRAWPSFDAQPPERSLLRLGVVRAVLALRRGDGETALESAARVEARQGRHADLAYLRGCALHLISLAAPPGPVRRGRAEEAALAYAQAVALRGAAVVEQITEAFAGPAALVRGGEALLVAGRPAEALRSFEAALKEAPASEQAQLGRAEAMLDQGDAPHALAMLEPLLGERADGWVLASTAARALGAEADAELLLARARERLPRGLVGLHRRERFAPPYDTPAPRARVQPGRERFAVTVISPPGYVHSGAFQEVAQTLLYGLRGLGCDAVLGTDPSLPGRRHIVLGVHLLPDSGLRLREGSVLYNLEQVEDGSHCIAPDLLVLYRHHPLWDYSRANANALVRLGVPRPAVVPIGYVPELTHIAPAQEDVDVLFYGSINDRRRAVLKELARRGAQVHVAFGVYGEDRDRLVARSRIVLNMHYYGAKVFEIVRVSYLLANRRVVVSERGCHPEEEAPFEAGVAFAPYEGLVDRCLELLARPDERYLIAEAGFQAISARPETEYLRNAVAGLTRG